MSDLYDQPHPLSLTLYLDHHDPPRHHAAYTSTSCSGSPGPDHFATGVDHKALFSALSESDLRLPRKDLRL